MKSFNLFLLWVCLLFIEVLSSNKAVPYELLYFYNVYKMESESEPAFYRLIATGCVPGGGRSGMCYFDDLGQHCDEARLCDGTVI